MSTTTENLKEAFAGESQANQMFRAFAARAEQEGLPNIARLFRTMAEAERIHAEGHLKNLQGIGTTQENLREAIAGPRIRMILHFVNYTLRGEMRPVPLTRISHGPSRWFLVPCAVNGVLVDGLRAPTRRTPRIVTPAKHAGCIKHAFGLSD